MTTDLDGTTRTIDGDGDATATVDMGAYEFDPLLVPGEHATIQAALDAAQSGDLVLVADGTYMGAGNRNLDFKDKAIYLRSVGGAANCIIDCQALDRGFNFHSGETADAVVDGFTIKNGGGQSYGAGIYCSSSSPTITNCTIVNNSTTWQGGGIYCNTSGPVISNCTIANNSAVEGGAVFCQGEPGPTIINCAITDNTAQDYGGGVNSDTCSPTITNCTIAGNEATSLRGGGIRCIGTMNATLNNTIVWGNSANFDGNQIYHQNSGTTVTLSYCSYGDAADDVAGSGTFSPSNCMTPASPLFVTGPKGDYYLSQVASGQVSDSPCVNAGSDTAANLGLDTKTTRTDQVPDSGQVDIGYHYDP